MRFHSNPLPPPPPPPPPPPRGAVRSKDQLLEKQEKGGDKPQLKVWEFNEQASPDSF
ncbi:unnamed protein product [Plutella xylostella]|uniref:(diamondback moth) hypothetical protein n=1 Tax=Plutella xylostella TaxID=51655 RepID=A0A8S4EB09_PLUXY|nr:unnamed protein product [Plutella xylostella]